MISWVPKMTFIWTSSMAMSKFMLSNMRNNLLYITPCLFSFAVQISLNDKMKALTNSFLLIFLYLKHPVSFLLILKFQFYLNCLILILIFF